MVAVKKNFMLQYYASLNRPERFVRGVRWRWEIWDDGARVDCPFNIIIRHPAKTFLYLDQVNIQGHRKTLELSYGLSSTVADMCRQILHE